MRRAPLVLVSLLGAGAVTAATASAQSPTVIVKVHQASGLVSPYFQLAASPAKTVSAGSLEIVNPASRTVTVTLDPVDAVTTNTLGSAYAQTNAAIHGATTWLRLGRRLVVIPRHASRTVSVSIDVPAGATPGDYLGGVSVEALGQSQTAKVTRGLAIGETDRYAIGVEVKLPGPRYPAVKLTGATVSREPAGLVFHVNASNTGNVILKNVRGWVRVTSGNRVVSAATVAPGTFVSGTSISYPLAAPREEPTPGSTYRVRGVLHYAGGVARLDTQVVFSHAAAVKQQNFGGRKLPKSTPPWRWLVLLLAVLTLAAVSRKLIRSRRRPLSRADGLKLLDRCLGPDGDRPVSIALIIANRRHNATIATAVRSRLRRGDRVCDLGRDGVLLICPTTARPVANALRDELEAHFARHPGLARVPFEIALATANKPTTAQKLLDRAKATERRHRETPIRPRRRPATTAGQR
jgi:Bacterial protein of unknown function (DUF916)